MCKSSSPFSSRLIQQNGRRILKRLLLFSLIWFALTGPDINSWLFGVPAIFAATWTSLVIASSTTFKISLAGTLRFIPFFLRQSLHSGLDVLRRTVSPHLPINPGLIIYKTYLPEGTARLFFVNTISLLPGTLSADIQDDNVTIHIIDIDTPFWPNIHNLEWRIAYLFKIIPSPKEVG